MFFILRNLCLNFYQLLLLNLVSKFFVLINGLEGYDQQTMMENFKIASLSQIFFIQIEKIKIGQSALNEFVIDFMISNELFDEGLLLQNNIVNSICQIIRIVIFNNFDRLILSMKEEQMIFQFSINLLLVLLSQSLIVKEYVQLMDIVIKIVHIFFSCSF